MKITFIIHKWNLVCQGVPFGALWWFIPWSPSCPPLPSSSSRSLRRRKYIRYDHDFSHSSSVSTFMHCSLVGLDGMLLALATLLFILFTTCSGDDEASTINIVGCHSCGRVHAALIVFLPVWCSISFVTVHLPRPPLWAGAARTVQANVGRFPDRLIGGCRAAAFRSPCSTRWLSCASCRPMCSRRGGALTGEGLRQRRTHEHACQVLVLCHAMPPWCQRAGRPVPVRRPEWHVLPLRLVLATPSWVVTILGKSP